MMINLYFFTCVICLKYTALETARVDTIRVNNFSLLGDKNLNEK